VGDTVTGFRSTDGATWTEIGSAVLAGPATIGLFVCAHNGGAVNNSTFDQVSVS
jgi:hypothetical protein